MTAEDRQSTALQSRYQKGVLIQDRQEYCLTFMEREQGGNTSSVLSVTLGSISSAMTSSRGRSRLYVRTAWLPAQGTEFSVFSGGDG